VLACSCSDGQGNYGPPTDTSSDSTLDEHDSSRVEIGPTMQQSTIQELLVAYNVPIVIAIVAILAVLLLVLRRRKKKA
jgi:LPXTG-motif cell wall-anchored protein